MVARHWFALVFVLAGYLSLKSLDNAAFWCDEAYVAVTARDYLKMGWLTGWNGRNLEGFRNGSAVDRNLRLVNAPLDTLVCAASFRVLGQSVWTARFPFVLAGLAALALFRALVRLEVGRRRHEGFQALAVCLLAFSAAYLLYLRQARYYSYSIAGALAVLYGYRLALVTRRRENGARAVAVLLMAAGGIVGFYANPMVCVAVYVALAVAHLVHYGWRATQRRWKIFGSAAWLFLMCTIPYAVRYAIWDRPDHTLYANDPWLISKTKLIWWNFRDLTWTSTLSYMVLPFVVTWLVASRRSRDRLARLGRFWAVLAVAYIGVLTILSPQTTPFPWPADARYQSAMLPTLACLSALGILWVWRRMRVGAVVLTAAALCVNPWTFHPLWPGRMQWLLPGYLKEIHTPYPTATGAVIDYLRENSKRDETLWSTPEYMNYAVTFALDDRLLLTGILNKKTHLPQEVVDKLPKRLQLEYAKPDWLVVYGNFGKPAEDTQRVLAIATADQQTSYAQAAKFDLIYRQTQRPELTDHTFGQPPGPLPEDEQVYIFRRIEANNLK